MYRIATIARRAENYFRRIGKPAPHDASAYAVLGFAGEALEPFGMLRSPLDTQQMVPRSKLWVIKHKE